jgi:hypothetical protein
VTIASIFLISYEVICLYFHNILRFLSFLCLFSYWILQLKMFGEIEVSFVAAKNCQNSYYMCQVYLDVH